ncbi:MAG: helix-turn-helix transcriptional regulator [bacterium]|nr:helix-turn-helix transcriptional regulator [bacterium]
MNNNKLSEYLKNKLKDKNLSMYAVSKRVENIFSYSYMRQIVNGDKKKPSPAVLKHLSAAIGAPYSDLLRAAGYITENDLEDVNSMLREMLSPMFDDEVVDIVSDKTMLDILKIILKLKGNDRKDLMKALKTYAVVFSSETKGKE